MFEHMNTYLFTLLQYGENLFYIIWNSEASCVNNTKMATYTVGKQMAVLLSFCFLNTPCIEICINFNVFKLLSYDYLLLYKTTIKKFSVSLRLSRWCPSEVDKHNISKTKKSWYNKHSSVSLARHLLGFV